MKSNKLPSYLLYKRILAEGKRLVALENENFLAILMRFAWKISELIIHRDRKVTSKLKVFYRFGKYLVFLNKKHGSLFVSKYLKASLLAIQRAIAGSPVSSLREIEPDLALPRLSRSGLPVWIGTRDRRAILSGSLSVVQFYLTLFSLYRVLEAPVTAKLSTITDPFNGNESFLEQSLGYFEFTFRKLIRVPQVNLRGKKGRDVQLLLLSTSSSSNKMFSWCGWAYDAWLIRRDPCMYPLIGKWLELTENFDLLSILNMARFKPGPVFGLRSGPIDSDQASLGRLSFKEEAAGKLRVFAMVDSWTQSIFKPLHDLLFQILAGLENDATFNQGSAFKRALKKAEKSGHSYGYDLSAATDRLPLILQIKILSGIIGPHLASLWGLILTARSYTVPKERLDSEPLYYAVGQPMGALSSWAMLALTHHAIVQYANHLIGGRGWTEDYEVLGDDIVIFNPFLAKKYVELMSLYGVGLNMSKSVISHKEQPVVEFAKRTSLKGKDVSPLSMKMFLNQDSFKGRLSIFAWWSKRIESHFIPAFKTIMKSVRWDNRPGNDKFALLGLLSLSVTSGVLPFQWILRELKDQRGYFVRKGKLLIANFDSTWGFQVAKAIAEQKDISSFEPRSPHSYMFEQKWYKAAVIRQIQRVIKSQGSVDPNALKALILKQIGISENAGLFSHHLWLPYLDGILATPYLTLRFYEHLELSKYSLEMLLTFLEEVESSGSTLSTFKKKKKEQKVLGDSLRLLQFIEKTITKDFRENQANQKLALESSWTQITERKSADPLNWLVPGYGGTTPAQGPVQWLGTNRGNPTPVEMPALTEERKRVLFGIRHPVTAPEPIVEPEESGFFFNWFLKFNIGFWLTIFIIVFSFFFKNDFKFIWPFSEASPPDLSGDGSSVLNGSSRTSAIYLLIFSLLFVLFFGGSWYFQDFHWYDWISWEYNWPPLETFVAEPPELSSFRFPTMLELIEYQNRSIPAIVRSPQIGHGWSEPWSFNESWPEWIR